MVREGVPLIVIQRQLGHSNLADPRQRITPTLTTKTKNARSSRKATEQKGCDDVLGRNYERTGARARRLTIPAAAGRARASRSPYPLARGPRA